VACSTDNKEEEVKAQPDPNVFIQVVDGPEQQIVISLHRVDDKEEAASAPGWVFLTEEGWEKFKAFGDDAIAIATGRKPPRERGDPDFYQARPVLPTYRTYRDDCSR
jgi:hypothetical protein